MADINNNIFIYILVKILNEKSTANCDLQVTITPPFEHFVFIMWLLLRILY